MYQEDQELIISDPTKFQQIMKALISEGIESLDIVTDFDFTLTRKEPEGDHGNDSSYSLFSLSPHLSKEFKDKRIYLYKTYSPYERDTTLDFAAKDKLMQEWYSRTLELVSSHKLSNDQIKESIYCTSMKLRHCSDELFKFASLLSIPMYVISAGIKEIIMNFLEMSIPSEFLEKITLIANACSKQTTPYVTTTNKDKFLHKSKFPLRRNAVLIGDLTEDIVMVANSDYKNVIKIGFMNGVKDKEYSQALYNQSYDVVIKGNGSMQHVLYLLSVIAMKPYVYKPSPSLAKCMDGLQNK